VTVNVNPAPTLTITPTMVSCAGTADTLSVTGGGSYLWSNGATTSTIIVNPATSKIYTVTTGGGGPCPVSAVDTVKVRQLPLVTLQGNRQICGGDSAIILATGGGTYVWTPGGNTSASIIVTPSSTTIYTLVVTKNGCSKDTTYMETVNPTPIPSVNPSITTICRGESAGLSASGGSTYLWSPAGTLSDSAIYNPVATPLLNTTYVVTVSNADGCTAKDSIKVFVIAGASGSACCDATIAPGGSQSLTISGASSGSGYSWIPSGSLSCSNCADPTATPTVTTWYYVTITDTANGCTRIDSVLITVNESGCGSVFVPTGFSPGQAVNNILYVRGDCIESMQFDIYDRWGNKVFTSTNIKNGWDGSYKGQNMNLGTYVYFLKANLIDGTTINTKGNVTLLR
ncbi:MAG TPA: gliding motility-associated C-terminal domain-containing protein, partial [Bacteroidia bacterium]|nr:gliding motility-associated C-terminal domain-containing protein [Bacteroidia bacterium]